MARRKYDYPPNRSVIAMERIDKFSHRISLSCGHFCTIGDPVKGKIVPPTKRQCHKCEKGMKREFVPPKKKSKKQEAS